MGENNTKQTYLSLRFAMVALTLLLLVSTAVQMVKSGCFLHSISAYYHTSARSVFVGALCAIGVCLIAYRGSTDKENVVLDYSGFMAFVVAFVPTEFDRTCTPDGVPSPSDAGLTAAVENNVLAVLGVALIAALVARAVPWLSPNPAAGPYSRFAKWTLAMTIVLLAVGFVVFFWQREWFLRHGHGSAAFLLFAGIIVVVWFNATDLATKRPDANLWWNRYTVMAAVMALTVVGCLALYLIGFLHAVLIVEILLIVEFAVFWIMQTVELRSEDVRPTPSQVPGNGSPEQNQDGIDPAVGMAQ